MNVPELETERLIMRGWRESDLEPMASFYTDEANCRFIGGVLPRDQVWRRMAMYVGHWVIRGYGFWVLEEKTMGKIAGWCGPWFPEGWPEPEIGWGLMPMARGKGYATEAAKRARDYAYGELGWTTVVSTIAPENTASQAVAARLGAKPDYETELLGTPVILYRHPSRTEFNKQQQYGPQGADRHNQGERHATEDQTVPRRLEKAPLLPRRRRRGDRPARWPLHRAYRPLEPAPAEGS